MNIFNTGNEFRVNSLKDYSKTMIYAEPMAEKLISKNLSSFLNNDFICNQYVDIPSLRNEKEAAEKLRPILNSVLGYLKLPIFVEFEVRFVDNTNTRIAGMYQSGRTCIVLNISPSYSFINVLAILAHECTHYFMEYNQLNWNDTTLNEERTDMMTCLIGFSNVLIQGYETIGTSEFHLGFVRTRTSKIGYIGVNECKELRAFILYQRKLLKEEENKQKEIIVKKTELKERISLLKEFENEIDLLNPLKHQELYSNKNYSLLQQAISDIHDFDSKHVIKEGEEALSSSDIDEIEKCIRLVNRQCEDLSKTVHTLQGLLD